VRSSFLPYYKPVLSEEDIDAVVQTMRNGWLTTGPVVKELEAEFERRSGVKHAIALNSCTAALHVALRAMDVGPGDEVVMPSLTFVAGAQCTLELGARPVFADIDPDTLSVTPETLEAVVTERTKVIVEMPYGGRPLDIAQIVEFAHKRGIKVLEDAAHAAGMLDRGNWSGTCSDAAAYSFYATKNMTTAEGGLLLTNDDAIAERARRLGDLSFTQIEILAALLELNKRSDPPLPVNEVRTFIKPAALNEPVKQKAVPGTVRLYPPDALPAPRARAPGPPRSSTPPASPPSPPPPRPPRPRSSTPPPPPRGARCSRS